MYSLTVIIPDKYRGKSLTTVYNDRRRNIRSEGKKETLRLLCGCIFDDSY